MRWETYWGVDYRVSQGHRGSVACPLREPGAPRGSEPAQALVSCLHRLPLAAVWVDCSGQGGSRAWDEAIAVVQQAMMVRGEVVASWTYLKTEPA